MRISDWSSDVCSSDLVGASGPFRRVLNLTEIGDIGRHAADVGDIFLILRVDIAERGRQRQPVADGGDVLAEPRAAFEFESLEARLAGVRHDAAEGRQAGDGARDRTRNLEARKSVEEGKSV